MPKQPTAQRRGTLFVQRIGRLNVVMTVVQHGWDVRPGLKVFSVNDRMAWCVQTFRVQPDSLEVRDQPVGGTRHV